MLSYTEHVQQEGMFNRTLGTQPPGHEEVLGARAPGKGQLAQTEAPSPLMFSEVGRGDCPCAFRRTERKGQGLCGLEESWTRPRHSLRVTEVRAGRASRELLQRSSFARWGTVAPPPPHKANNCLELT